jgi:hypothetical protein
LWIERKTGDEMNIRVPKENKVLKTWLNLNQRDSCPYSQFEVIDMEKKEDLSPEMRSDLVDLLRAARFNP